MQGVDWREPLHSVQFIALVRLETWLLWGLPLYILALRPLLSLAHLSTHAPTHIVT